MAKRQFSPAERWAIYTIQGDGCYLCRRPIDLKSMHVDHVLPECLANDPVNLKRHLSMLGLPDSFDLQGYANLLPSCVPCNLKKAATIFEPSLMLQIELQRAGQKAVQVAQAVAKTVSNRALASALNTVERAVDEDEIALETLMPLIEVFLRNKPEAMQAFREQVQTTKLEFMVQDEPVLEFRVSPSVTVEFGDGRARVIQGNYGSGISVPGPDVDPSWICARCGNYGPWNGARCMSCGFMDCGD